MIQIPSGQLPRLLPTLRSLLVQLEPYTRGELICGDRSEAAQLNDELRSWRIWQADRFRIHTNGAVGTLWARDRFLGGTDTEGRVVLLCPSRRLIRPVGDYGLPWFLRRRMEESRVETIPLNLEGGDLVAGGTRIYVGARTIALGAASFPPLKRHQVRQHLESLFQKPVLVAAGHEGAPRGGDLDYHLDMYLTVAHDDSVLLADPAWRSLDLQWRAVDEELVAATQARLEGVRRRLESAGIPVHRLPAKVFPRRHCAASYNNVLQEQTSAGPVVYLPQYGLSELDREAILAYQRLGYQVRLVDSRHLYELRGSLRCVVNVVQRRMH